MSRPRSRPGRAARQAASPGSRHSRAPAGRFRAWLTGLRGPGVPGDDLPFVQLQLDDPGEFEGETIVVVGAGDAAIENAVALSKQNNVVIINRKDEFNRAKKGNEAAILKAIEDGVIECYYGSAPEKVDALPEGARKKGRMVLSTPGGRAQILCDRIIARLGASAPRGFVEACRSRP